MPIAAARRLAAPGRAPIWVLVLSGLLGFWFGFVAYPTWQVAVEPAQVVAGLVSYPAGNPNYIYQSKLWTILHQVNALVFNSDLYFKVCSRTGVFSTSSSCRTTLILSCFLTSFALRSFTS